MASGEVANSRSQPRFYVRDRHMQLGRCERGPERGVDVPVHDEERGAAVHQFPLYPSDYRGRLLSVRPGAHVQVDVRLGQAEVGEEHVRHPRVVMLPRVNEHLLHTEFTQRGSRVRPS